MDLRPDQKAERTGIDDVGVVRIGPCFDLRQVREETTLGSEYTSLASAVAVIEHADDKAVEAFHVSFRIAGDSARMRPGLQRDAKG